jgi:putative CRISPR-associated protein (TIGR02619 family)
MKAVGNLICTVGTSLISNLKRMDPEKFCQDLQRSHKPQDIPYLSVSGKNDHLNDPEQLKILLTKIQTAFRSSDYKKIASLFTELPPNFHLLGAEINSIEAMIRKNFLSENRFHLILMVSDTPEGQMIGQILEHYFIDSDCSIKFENCHVEKVEGLQDEEPLNFQKTGLPNLVRLLGEQFRKWGGEIAINATGGYKAQIALAVAFGQASGSSVFYKHERFDQIIRFPKIPFSLDLSMVEKNLKLWADLSEPGSCIDREHILNQLGNDTFLHESFLPLLECVEEGSDAVCSLSALGMVYWEAFRSLIPKLTLKPPETRVREGCHFRDDHYPDKFKPYVKKFYKSFPKYVRECHSLPYSGQPSIKNRFVLRKGSIIGEYQDRDNFGARFEVSSSAENALEKTWLVDHFNLWLGRDVEN